MNHKGMKYSLCSRELIADSIEVMLTAHPLDAIVFIPNCDKIVPGMLLAACRLNLPCIFINGGPMLPGKSTETKNPIGLSEQFEYVGANAVGKMSLENLEQTAYGLPDLRLLFGYVHGKFNELPYRINRYVTSGFGYNSGCLFCPSSSCKDGRRKSYGSS